MDLIGNVFGKLTVLERVDAPENLKDKKSMYLLCKCECGNKKVIRKISLTSGRTVSCGCHRKETQSERGKKQKKHGLSKTRFYRTWSHMIRRCEEESYNEYHLYGERGIKVCKEWHTFENFMNDMYESYLEFEKENGKNSASIDRIDSNGNYEKSNCKWATQLEQARNRKDNISIIADGVKYKTLSELAEKYNLESQLVWGRYRQGKRGKDLTKPKKRNNKGIHKGYKAIKVEVNGVQYESLTALQKDYPYISIVSITKRYKKGLRGIDLVKKRGE